MENRLDLKGEYTFHITYSRMFGEYRATFHHHNLITSDGLEFLIRKWTDDYDVSENQITRYRITKIIVGHNTTKPTSDDTISTFIKIDDVQNPFTVNTYADGNKLVLSTNNLSGRVLNNTTEIGVIGERQIETVDPNTGDVLDVETVDTILISRDTHPIINIPNTCIINLEYIYTLTSLTIDECEE